jgi:hypothetical protein
MLPLQQSYEVKHSILEYLKATYSFKDNGNFGFSFHKVLLSVDESRLVWNIIKYHPPVETFEHTMTHSELYYSKQVTYCSPFEECNRVEDYRVAWAWFEGVFKGGVK